MADLFESLKKMFYVHFLRVQEREGDYNIPPRNSQNVRFIFNFYIKFSSQPVFENYYVSRSVKETIYYRLEISQKSVLYSFSIVNLGAS